MKRNINQISLRTTVLSNSHLLSIVLLILILIMYIPPWIVDYQTFKWLEKEDGVYEYLGAFLFLLTSINFLYLYFKQRQLYNKKNFFVLGLAIIFFLGFGEEISWGQRIFHFDNPDIFDKINAQHEFNIHNLKIFHGNSLTGNRKTNLELLLNVDRLFSVFWFSFCILLPFFAKWSFWFSKRIKKIGFPLVPLTIGYLFPLNYFFSKIFDIIGNAETVEIKETNFAILFLGVSYYMRQRQLKILENVNDSSSAIQLNCLTTNINEEEKVSICLHDKN